MNVMLELMVLILIETEDSIYVIEVKLKPEIHDVDDLLNKFERVKQSFVKSSIPVIAGIWIGNEVESYAKGKGVEVWKF